MGPSALRQRQASLEPEQGPSPTRENPFPAPTINPAISRQFSISSSMGERSLGREKKLILALVGLPGQGKTYVASKLGRWLRWLGFECQVFSSADARRRQHGAQTAAFFDPLDPVAMAKRDQAIEEAVENMCGFFHGTGEIGVLDSTNFTVNRRKKVVHMLEASLKDPLSFEIVWIELLQTEDSSTDASPRRPAPSPPVASGHDAALSATEDQAARDDMNKRIEFYRSVYTSVGRSEFGGACKFIRIVNGGEEVTARRISGYVPGKVLNFLLNLRIAQAPIFITRHGESEYNVAGRLGGDAPLSLNGQQYGAALAQFIPQRPEFAGAPPKVWSSTLRRTMQTAVYLKTPVQWRALSEIEVGRCDGLTYKEVERRYPEEFQARREDKLRYRYPRGESYTDVIQRLEPVIFELERSTVPVLVVGHRAVLRCLYAYLMDQPRDRIPYLSIPLHTVMKLESKPFGCDEAWFRFGPDIVETDMAPPPPEALSDEKAVDPDAAKEKYTWRQVAPSH